MRRVGFSGMSAWRRPGSSHRSSGGAHSCSFMKRDRVSRRRSLPFSCRSVRSGHLLFFVDNAAKKASDQRYFSGADRDTEINRFAQHVAAALEAAYRKEADHARSRGNQLQPAESTLRRMQDSIILKVQEARDSWCRCAALTMSRTEGQGRLSGYRPLSSNLTQQRTLFPRPVPGGPGRATTAECPRIMSISSSHMRSGAADPSVAGPKARTRAA